VIGTATIITRKVTKTASSKDTSPPSFLVENLLEPHLREVGTSRRCTKIVTHWLEHPILDLLHPTERHWSILSKLLKDGQAYGPLVMDAHLAALAIEHGAKLYTTDKDFSRFEDLQVINPLLD